MAQVNEPRGLADLISGLAADISGLFRKEIQLAKAEASEKVGQVIGGVELLLAGAVLALGALGVLLAAIVSALAAVFVANGMGQTGANGIAAAIIGILVAIVAWVLVSRGLSALKASNLNLERTTNALAQDADIVKERL
ncbi:phage holin family protein [Arsenicitalea aurantiaca]|uniref:Phage holin family protein n=1 Tax=Arsenicitalea aurantiaca TaxID=1783274 RepID=A0A433X3H5_9HYPH|nr:phage holin family protein [Arsenicitalea aurantiaca]RUT28614.1 phage holin family protein [Arsenicitalea aurantiaca]